MRYNQKEFEVYKKKLKAKTSVRIISGSMEPWIKVGEEILVSPIKAEDLKPFDLILYWDSNDQRLICHIFISFRDDFIICKPLIQNKEDTPVKKEFLFAVVDKPRFKWFHKILLKLFYR